MVVIALLVSYSIQVGQHSVEGYTHGLCLSFPSFDWHIHTYQNRREGNTMTDWKTSFTLTMLIVGIGSVVNVIILQ